MASPALIEHDTQQPSTKKREYNFKPGNVANPAGRPPVIKHVRDLCKEHTKEMIELLLACARDDSERWQVRQTAIQEVLNRGWGKVNHSVDITTNQNTNITMLTTDEIQKMLLENVNTEVKQTTE